jgi:16S rRNA (adenine1518-N6/adenine1519-N6)-dimethyltransferase
MRWLRRISFGQHTLINLKILANIIEASQISNDEIVCEAGTGNGILTHELCKQAKSVISFELDNLLFSNARKNLFYLSNLNLVNADLFKRYNVDFNVFVSNLPYSKSKDAFYWLPFQTFNRAIIMVQKEFADKLEAAPGEENYRAISVITQHCFNIQSLFNVDRKAFYPEPTVESVVIRLVPTGSRITRQTIKNVNFMFSQRNKKASSIAKKFGNRFEFGDTRIDKINTKELIKLAESIEFKVHG